MHVCTCLRATIIQYMYLQCSTDVLTGSHIVAGAESKLTGLLVGEWEEPVHCVCSIWDCGEEAESITWWAGSIVWEWAESTLADQWSGCCWACWDTDDISLPPVLCICVWCPHCNIPTSIHRVVQQGRNGYKVSNNFQFRVALGRGPHKTLPENTCVTGDVIHRQKCFKYASTMKSNFLWPKNFSAVSSRDELQINQ